MILLHATCVAIAGRAVLIEGPSGSGKSDLALRLIDRGALLVADDQTEVRERDGVLYAGAPATIAGRLEVRGLGIVSVPYLTDVPLTLAVRAGAPERMPAPQERVIAGLRLPALTVAALEASAPVKVEWALRRVAP